MFKRLLPTLPSRLHFSPSRFFPALSVRARIAALALIPVVGFIANGLNYVVSEREVGSAFEAVTRSGILTNSSRDFRAALESIRHAAKEMVARPSQSVVKTFHDNHAVAVKSLDRIQKNGDPDDTRLVPHIQRTGTGLKENFASLIQAQEQVGVTEQQGINKKLRDAADKIGAGSPRATPRSSRSRS